MLAAGCWALILGFVAYHGIQQWRQDRRYQPRVRRAPAPAAATTSSTILKAAARWYPSTARAIREKLMTTPDSTASVEQTARDILIEAMRRPWTPPGYGTLYRRKTDQTVWTVRCVYTRDRQVRLERNGARACFPFADMLARDYDRLTTT